MQNTSNQKKLFGIQVLRALAAAMVVYVHALSNFHEKVDKSFIPNIGYDLGELGVKLFFCISGFIIYTTSKSFAPSFDSIRTFFEKRFIRIVPIYWFFTIVYALKLALQGTPPLAQEIINSMFFIPYSTNGELMRPVIGQGWTLNYEVFFYFLFGIGLYFRKFWRLILISISLSTLMLARYLGFLEGNESFLCSALYFLSDYYLIYFLIGVFIALLYERSLFSSLLSDTSKLIYFGLLVFFYIAFKAMFVTSNIFNEILMASFCVASMYVALTNTAIDFNESFSNIKNKMYKWLELFGNASYSTYLTHGFVLGLFSKLASKLYKVDPLAFSLLMIFVCSVVGFVVYKLIETPLLNFLNSRITRDKP